MQQEFELLLCSGKNRSPRCLYLSSTPLHIGGINILDVTFTS